MNRMALFIVALGGAVAAGAQPQQRAVIPPAERPASETVAGQTIDPRVYDRIRLPVGEMRADTVLVNPNLQSRAAAAAAAAQNEAARPAADRAVMVDLGALRNRVGGDLADIWVMRENTGTAAPVGGESEAVSLAPGDVLAVQRAGVEASTDETDGVAVTSSPTILYTVDAAGRARELGLVHRSAGLYWQPDQERFAGELLVGVLDREDPQASGPLGATIPVQLLAPPGALDASNLEVTRIGLPFQRVAVTVAVPEDPFPIEFLSQIDPDLPRAGLRVVRPQLALSAPDRIQGFGVGEAAVTISGVEAGLRPGQAITLNLDNGWLADRTVIVAENGTAETRLRSNWLGQGTLTVVAPGVYQAAPRQIGYTFPLRFMAATLLGGMLGAIVLVYSLKRHESGSKRSYRLDWVVGVVIGAGVTTMAYAGMKLPEWLPLPSALAGEVAPFALSFIAAAAGAALIHSITGGTRQPAG